MGFTPRKNDKRKLSILLDDTTVNILDEKAAKADISRNEIISQCIEYALNDIVEHNESNGNGSKSFKERLKATKNDKNVKC